MSTADPRPLDLTETWRRAEPVLWRRTLAGVVVLPTRGRREPVALDGPAAGLWELLAEPMSARDVVAALAETYEVEDTRVAGDVGAALDVLVELGALCRS